MSLLCVNCEYIPCKLIANRKLSFVAEMKTLNQKRKEKCFVATPECTNNCNATTIGQFHIESIRDQSCGVTVSDIFGSVMFFILVHCNGYDFILCKHTHMHTSMCSSLCICNVCLYFRIS